MGMALLLLLLLNCSTAKLQWGRGDRWTFDEEYVDQRGEKSEGGGSEGITASNFI